MMGWMISAERLNGDCLCTQVAVSSAAVTLLSSTPFVDESDLLDT